MPAWGILLLPVLLVGFIVSATCGFGGKLLLVPVLALWLGAPTAVAIAAPVMLLNSVIKSAVLRKDIDWRQAGWVMAGSVPGAYLGARVLASLPADLATRLIGLLLLAGIAITMAKPVLWPRLSGLSLVLGGFAAGASSGVAGMGGPVKAITLRGAGLSRAHLVATAAVVDIAMAMADIPVYVETGLIRQEHLPLVVLLAGVAWVGVGIGRNLLKEVSEGTYRFSFGFVLTATCLYLVISP